LSLIPFVRSFHSEGFQWQSMPTNPTPRASRHSCLRQHSLDQTLRHRAFKNNKAYTTGICQMGLCPHEKSPNNKRYKIYRKLSPTEDFYYLAAKRQQGWGTSAICLRLRVSAPYPEHVSEALAYLKTTHEMLNYRIKEVKQHAFGVANAHWIIPQQTQDIPVDFQWSTSENDWKEALNQLVEEHQYLDQAPLIHFKLLYNQEQGTCDVLLGFHHALTDGAGAWHLMQAFTQMSWPTEHKTPPDCHGTQHLPKPIHPSQRNWQPDAKQIATMIHRTLNNMLRLTATRLLSQTHTTPEPLLPQTLPTLAFERRMLLPHDLKRLAQQSRQQGSSLHACITAAALKVSAPLFKPLGKTGTPIGYTVPVNLRERIHQWPTHELGVRVFAVNLLGFIPNGSKHDLWALAKECHQQLKSHLDSDSPQSNFLLMEHVLKTKINEKFIMDQIPKDQVLINNLGRILIPEKLERCSYEALSWATHMGENASLLRFYFASLDDTLSITVQSSQLPQHQIASIADDLMITIHSMLDET